MAYYFCINDLLGRMEDAGSEAIATLMAPVSAVQPSCGGYREDAFILSSVPDMLDLDNPDGLPELASLLEDVPLYRINMELALDRALTERHGNAPVRAALEKAFGGKPLPSTLSPPREDGMDETGGSLRHPVLGHTETEDLCKIYVLFLKTMERGNVAYAFDSDIIGRHAESFLNVYDGFIVDGGGLVRADTLMGFGVRVDHDHGKTPEAHVEEGSRRAKTMMPEEPQERIWAWLEADHYQMRRCRDIHRILMLPGSVKRRPTWVRSDVLNLLEREAMKQAFADMIVESKATMKLLDQAPAIKKAVHSNAAGDVDEGLQALVAQILNARGAYAGSAHRFAQDAREREIESKRMRFV